MPTILMQHADHGHMHVYSAPERVTAEAAGWTAVVAEPVKAPEPTPAPAVEPVQPAIAPTAPQTLKRPYKRHSK